MSNTNFELGVEEQLEPDESGHQTESVCFPEAEKSQVYCPDMRTLVGQLMRQAVLCWPPPQLSKEGKEKKNKVTLISVNDKTKATEHTYKAA